MPATDDRERWQRVAAICDEALELDGRARADFLGRACAQDPHLRGEVDALLLQTAAADGFLSTPAAAMAHDALAASPSNLVGRTVGGYEIRGVLGAGGMGVVYRAADRALGRDVALKVLPEGTASDPDRLSRFRREAKLLATLNHPHIGGIYGFVEDGPTCALVLELLEGDTVDALLVHGPLRISQALTIAIQVAEALDHVHRRGITHRDLKPSNILVTKSGARLLDFGIGKLSAADGLLRPVGFTTETKAGAMIGTLNYMAPEQLEGGEVGPRTDLFAFGAVLYEMLAGRRAFDGSSRASIVAAIINSQPPPLAERARGTLPPRLHRIVTKSLAKDPDARWQSARDLADELKWTADERPQEPAATRRRTTTWPLAVAAAILTLAIAIVALTGWPGRTSPPVPATPVRFTIAPEPNVRISPMDFSLSRDGRLLVYNGRGAAGPRIYMRRLDSFETVSLLPGLGYAVTIGPDNESAAFFSRDSLYRVALRGDSPPVLLAQLGGVPLSIDWTIPETLLVAGRETAILRVLATGGPATAITAVTTDAEVDHHTPRMLPGGDAVLFAVHGVRNRFSVAVQSLTTGVRKALVTNGFKPTYSPTGHLVFGRGSSLLAAPFDLKTLTLTGTPVTVLQGVAQDASSGDIGYQLSDSGALVYHANDEEPRRTLTWVDRRGKETALGIPPRAIEAPRLSPDGKRIAFHTSENGSRRIWTHEMATDTLTPITVEGDNWGPIWTRDGAALAYGTDRTDASHVVVHRFDGRPPTSIGSSVNDLWPMSFAADGSLIVSEDPPTDNYRVSRLRPGAPSQPEQIIGGPGFPNMARLSPDGRWLAYQMTQGGRIQVFVEPASGEGPRRQVTIDGGRSPVWSHDGRELFFRRGRQMLAVTLDRGGFGFSKPTILFEGDFVGQNADFDVAPDGRFVMIKADPQQRIPSELKVILNWSDELLRRVPIPR